MDRNYWLGRWERGETGWHQTEVEPALVAHFSSLAPTRVLVPLCGKSLDLNWLASQGHSVIGVEMSELACHQFFIENRIPFRKSVENGISVFRSDQVTLYNCDFFQLQPEQLGQIGAIYDRAALIALPETIRSRYAAQVVNLIRECAQSKFDFLQIVLERTPQDSEGPPFSVPKAELERLYGHDFKISLLSREKIEMERFSENITHECIYRLSL